MDPPTDNNDDDRTQPFLALPYASVVLLSKLLCISPSEIGELLNAQWFPPELLTNSNSTNGDANHVEAENGQIEAIAATANTSRSLDPQLTENLTPSTEGENQNDVPSNDLFPSNIDEFLNEFFDFGWNQEEVEQQQDQATVPLNTSDSQLDTTPLNTTNSAPNNLETPSEDADNFEEPNQRVNKSRREAQREINSRGCSCKNSKCMKYYCSCFEKGYYCGEACSCDQCLNIAYFADLVETSRNKPRDVEVRKICWCKKAFCEKKYCKCFQADVGCSDKCRCVNCKNPQGTRYGCSQIPEMKTSEGANAGINCQQRDTHASSLSQCVNRSTSENGAPDCQHPVIYNPMPTSVAETSEQLFNCGIDRPNFPEASTHHFDGFTRLLQLPGPQSFQAKHSHGCRENNTIMNMKDTVSKRPRFS